MSEENPADLLSLPVEPEILASIESPEEDYDRVISEKLKLLEEYEALEKELQTKRQQLESDLNLSINKSKGLNTPDKKPIGTSHLLKSSANMTETDSNARENPIRLSKNLTGEKENLQGNEFLTYYMKVSSDTKIREKDENDYTFKPKINKSTTKKNLDQISESRDGGNRLEELYKLGVDKKKKQQELTKQANSEAEKAVNQEKVSVNSKKILMKNMEKSLERLLIELQSPENKGFFNFSDVGNLLFKLAIFKGTHFKRASYLEKPKYEPTEIEKNGLETLIKESLFHEEFWKLLIIPQLVAFDQDPQESLAQNIATLVPRKLLLDVILALFETNKDKAAVAIMIRDRLASSYRKKEVPFDGSADKKFDVKADFESELCMPLEKFISKFRKLFVDKTQLMKIYFVERPERDFDDSATSKFVFKPTINEKSKNIDSQDNYVSKLVSSTSMRDLASLPESTKNRFDLLYNYSKFETKRKEEESKARLKEDDKDCTFAPKINNKKQFSSKKKKAVNDVDEATTDQDDKKHYERLYALYKKRLEKEEINTKIIQEREDEKLVACTFKPQTNPSKNLEKSLHTGNVSVKGSDKVIERVAKAREERLEKISIFENMGKPKAEGLQPTVFQPFSFEKRYEKEKETNNKEEPLLYLDINYGPGKIARIPVRKSDDPHVLCKTFSKIYSLNEKMQTTLLETIQNIFHTQIWEEKKQI